MKKNPEEKKQPFVFENDFSWDSLTRIEQTIIRELYRSKYAINSMQVYYQVVKNVIYFQEDSNILDIAQLQSKEVLRNTPTSILTEEGHVDLLSLSRREAERIIASHRKKGVAIPAYTTIIRMLNAFVKIGWVSKREPIVGRASVVYFLPYSIRKALDERFKSAVEKKD